MDLRTPLLHQPLQLLKNVFTVSQLGDVTRVHSVLCYGISTENYRPLLHSCSQSLLLPTPGRPSQSDSLTLVKST